MAGFSSGIQVHQVPASHGWHWLRQGLRLLGMAPLPLLLLMLMLITASNLLGLLGLFGTALAKVVSPVLLVGYLSVLRRLAPPGAHNPLALPPAPHAGHGTGGSQAGTGSADVHHGSGAPWESSGHDAPAPHGEGEDGHQHGQHGTVATDSPRAGDAPPGRDATYADRPDAAILFPEDHATPPAPREPGNARSLSQLLNMDTLFGWTRRHPGALQVVLLLGLLSLGIDLGAAWLSGYQDAVTALIGGLQTMPANAPPDAERLATLVMPVFNAMMAMAVITVPCYVLLWYAPIFAGMHGLPFMKAVVFSAVAVGRNVLGFIAHVFCLLGFMIALMMVAQLLGGILGMPALLPFGSPVFLMVMPVLFSVIACAQWACYLDTVETHRADIRS